MPFSNISGSYVNQAWRTQRHWVTDLHLKLKSGLIKSSMFYPAVRIFPPTDGPYGTRVNRPKEVFMKEDKLRHMFRVMYPVEATKSWMAGKGDDKWFMHPQDKWVRDHLKFMDKGMNLAEAHAKVLRKKEQDEIISRLEQRYRLQKLQEQGLPPMGKMPLDADMLTAKEEMAKRDLMTTTEEEQHKLLHRLVLQRLAQPEEERTKIGNDDFLHTVKLFPDEMIRSFVDAHPQYTHLFDEITLQETSLSRLFFPLEDHASAHKVREVFKEIDKRWDESETIVKNRMGIFAANLQKWLKLKQLNGRLVIFDEEMVSYMDAMDASATEDWKQGGIAGSPETTGGAIMDFLEFSGVKDAKELHRTYKEDINSAKEKLMELMAKYDSTGEYQKKLAPLREQERTSSPPPDDTKFGLYPPRQPKVIPPSEQISTNNVLELIQEYIETQGVSSPAEAETAEQSDSEQLSPVDEVDVVRSESELRKKMRYNDLLRRMQVHIDGEDSVYSGIQNLVEDPLEMAAWEETQMEQEDRANPKAKFLRDATDLSTHLEPTYKYGIPEALERDEDAYEDEELYAMSSLSSDESDYSTDLEEARLSEKARFLLSKKNSDDDGSAPEDDTRTPRKIVRLAGPSVESVLRTGWPFDEQTAEEDEDEEDVGSGEEPEEDDAVLVDDAEEGDVDDLDIKYGDDERVKLSELGISDEMLETIRGKGPGSGLLSLYDDLFSESDYEVELDDKDFEEDGPMEIDEAEFMASLPDDDDDDDDDGVDFSQFEPDNLDVPVTAEDGTVLDKDMMQEILMNMTHDQYKEDLQPTIRLLRAQLEEEMLDEDSVTDEDSDSAAIKREYQEIIKAEQDEIEQEEEEREREILEGEIVEDDESGDDDIFSEEEEEEVMGFNDLKYQAQFPEYARHNDEYNFKLSNFYIDYPHMAEYYPEALNELKPEYVVSKSIPDLEEYDDDEYDDKLEPLIDPEEMDELFPNEEVLHEKFLKSIEADDEHISSGLSDLEINEDDLDVQDHEIYNRATIYFDSTSDGEEPGPFDESSESEGDVTFHKPDLLKPLNTPQRRGKGSLTDEDLIEEINLERERRAAQPDDDEDK